MGTPFFGEAGILIELVGFVRNGAGWISALAWAAVLHDISSMKNDISSILVIHSITWAVFSPPCAFFIGIPPVVLEALVVIQEFHVLVGVLTQLAGCRTKSSERFCITPKALLLEPFAFNQLVHFIKRRKTFIVVFTGLAFFRLHFLAFFDSCIGVLCNSLASIAIIQSPLLCFYHGIDFLTIHHGCTDISVDSYGTLRIVIPPSACISFSFHKSCISVFPCMPAVMTRWTKRVLFSQSSFKFFLYRR